MKKIIGLTIIIVLWIVAPSSGEDSQDNEVDPSYREYFQVNEVAPSSDEDLQVNGQFIPATGDSDFDIVLNNINTVARNKGSVFVTDLSSSFNIPGTDIDFLIVNEKIQPADAFMIFQLVKISGRPLDQVIKQFRKHRNKGWGAIALSFGIKPGSETFFLLKNNIPPTIWKYRVIEIKGSKGSKGKKHKKGSKGSKGKKHKKGSKGKKYKKHQKGSKGKKI